MDGDERYTFSYVADVEPLPDGVAVSDGLSREIRIYGRDGIHRVSFGRAGRGPGEFQEPPALRFVPPDTLIAWDIRQRRLTWFDLDGRVLRDLALGTIVPAGDLPNTYVSEAWKLLSDGSLAIADDFRHSSVLLVDVGTARTLHVTPVRSTRGPPNPVVRRSRGAGVIVYSPFLAREAVAVRTTPPTVWVTDSLAWDIRGYGKTGQLEGVIRIIESRTPVSRELRTQGRDWLAERWNWGSDTHLLEEAFDNLDHPDSVAAIGSIEWASPNRLLIGRHALGVRSVVRDFEILTDAGEWVVSLHLTDAAGYFRAAGYGRLFTVWFDELGVSHLKAFEWRPEW